MQNPTNRGPQSRLPIGLIKFFHRLQEIKLVVLLLSAVGSFIMSLISNAGYDWMKEQRVQNLWTDALYFLYITLLIVLIFMVIVISLRGVRMLRQKPKRSTPLVVKMAYLMLLLVVICSIVWYVPPLHSLIFPPGTGLGVSYPDANAAPTGLCDGSCVIDVHRLDGELKQEAADQINLHNDTDRACSYWQLASIEDTADAEAKIAIENNCGRKNVKQYINFVVVVQFAGNDNVYLNGKSRNTLQGAYLMQKKYNDAHPEGPLLYLFIANIGDPAVSDATQQQVAERILQTGTSTHKIVGVVGLLPYGSNDIVQSLSQAGYPMVSIVPADSASGIAYFRSVAPTLEDEANAAVKFLESQHCIHVALYSAYGYDGNYSSALTTFFTQSFSGRLVQNTYAEGSDSDLNDIATSVAKTDDQAIYFVGPPDDASVLNAALRRLHKHIIVIGSDVMYQWVYASHTGQQRANFNDIFFTAFAYHSPPGTSKDETLKMLIAYRESFNPNKYYVGYFYNNPASEAILTLDATNLLIKAAVALNRNDGNISTEDLWKSLTTINSSKGISGQINYANANSSFPDQKAVFVLSIQTAGNRYEGIYAGSL